MRFLNTLLPVLGLAGYTSAQVVVNQLVGYATLNGGTTGGASGPIVTVTTCAALVAAVAGTSAQTVRINGTLSGCGVVAVGSNKSILGVGSTATLKAAGFRIRNQSNVIIRNIHFDSPPVEADAIDIDATTNVWIDHCVFNSDLDHDKDYYDGLIDIKHGSDWITISWCQFHDHWKASLVGHSDSNSAEDTGKLHITYHHNYWNNINSRTPSFRFGTGHIYSSCYLNILESGINSRMGAVLRIEECYFENAQECIVTNLSSAVEGFVYTSNNVFGPDTTTSITQVQSFTPPYPYWLTPASQVCTKTLTYAGVGVI